MTQKIVLRKGPFDGQSLTVTCAPGVRITELVLVYNHKNCSHYECDPSLEAEQGHPAERDFVFVDDPFDTHDFLESMVL